MQQRSPEPLRVSTTLFSQSRAGVAFAESGIDCSRLVFLCRIQHSRSLPFSGKPVLSVPVDSRCRAFCYLSLFFFFQDHEWPGRYTSQYNMEIYEDKENERTGR